LKTYYPQRIQNDWKFRLFCLKTEKIGTKVGENWRHTGKPVGRNTATGNGSSGEISSQRSALTAMGRMMYIYIRISNRERMRRIKKRIGRRRIGS
jgi:hypothetical protein